MSILVVLNWKMHPASQKEAQSLFAATRQYTEKVKDIHVIVAPPVVYLGKLRSAYKGKKISFAVQSARADAVGAFTGSTSMTQAQNVGAHYAIIGHAERRAEGETNDDTRREVAAAYALGMTPILCIGEKTRSGENEHFAFIREQLRIGCTDVPATKIANIIIAYEPVWAIGATKPMAPHEMHEMAVFIRKTLHELYGPRAMNASILYGGSIDDSSAPAMLKLGDVKGLLIGRASVDQAALKTLVESITNS
ncbi:MAG: triosephosphate isomerase, triosephosphate isomerase [Candidatus Kaiserbacteria bacterium]|nr:triosephosphate isomerase, triosephosphate isomerase [Candidatus Kaiserbacteria bacterium]